LTDGTQGLSYGETTEVVEDEIRKHLEDAMTESPLKDTRKGKGCHFELLNIFHVIRVTMHFYMCLQDGAKGTLTGVFSKGLHCAVT